MERAASIAEEERGIEEEFALFDEPREKLEYLLELGRTLPSLDAAHRTEANRVRGCQSQVWMVARFDPETRRLHLEADSDALIVRGLIALLLRLYSGRTPEDILAHPPRVFEAIGLGRLLTPGRQNGLYAMVERIRELARIYAGVGRIHGAVRG